MSDSPLGRLWLATTDGKLPGRVREVQYDRILFQIEAPLRERDTLEFSLDLPDLGPQVEGKLMIERVMAVPVGQPAIYMANVSTMSEDDRDRLGQWLDERTAIGALANEPPGARDYDELDDQTVTVLEEDRRSRDGTVGKEDQQGRSAIGRALRKGVQRSARRFSDGMQHGAAADDDDVPDWMG